LDNSQFLDNDLESKIENSHKRLTNETFLSKAPKDVVEDLKKTHLEDSNKLKEIDTKIKTYK
jgi:valyl-tRNA synthetase